MRKINNVEEYQLGNSYENNNLYKKPGCEFAILEADNSDDEYSPVYFKIYFSTEKVELLGNMDWKKMLKLFEGE